MDLDEPPLPEVLDVNYRIPCLENKIKKNPHLHLPIMYRALQAIEELKDQATGELLNVENPITRIQNIPEQYFRRKFRQKLEKGQEGQIYPIFFQKKVSKNVTMSYFRLKEELQIIQLQQLMSLSG